MGTVHQLRLERLRRRFSGDLQPRRFLRPSDISLFFGVLVISAAIGAKAIGLWHEPRSAQSQPVAGVRVIDGDSLKTNDGPIRLIGIDAPELHQTCRDAQGREWHCGREARRRLAEFVSKGGVACKPQGQDRYGRTLAVCSAGNIPDVGEVLVREGYAVNYAFSNGGYPAAEREAQAAGRGVWQGEFERPQDWRRRHPRRQ
jgi:endonuclease YncB( thermonuclease family)